MWSYSLDQCLFLAYKDAFRQNRTHPILLASEKAYSTTECEDKCQTRQTFPPKIIYHNHLWNNAMYICTHFCPFVCIIESYVHYILSMFDKWDTYPCIIYMNTYIDWQINFVVFTLIWYERNPVLPYSASKLFRQQNINHIDIIFAPSPNRGYSNLGSKLVYCNKKEIKGSHNWGLRY